MALGTEFTGELIIKGEDADSLVAYILSLRKPD
jgi:hypothetical protein